MVETADGALRAAIEIGPASPATGVVVDAGVVLGEAVLQGNGYAIVKRWRVESKIIARRKAPLKLIQKGVDALFEFVCAICF